MTVKTCTELVLYSRRVSVHFCSMSQQKSKMTQQQRLLPTPAGLLRKAKYKTLKNPTSPLFLRPKTTSWRWNTTLCHSAGVDVSRFGVKQLVSSWCCGTTRTTRLLQDGAVGYRGFCLCVCVWMWALRELCPHVWMLKKKEKQTTEKKKLAGACEPLFCSALKNSGTWPSSLTFSRLTCK